MFRGSLPNTNLPPVGMFLHRWNENTKKHKLTKFCTEQAAERSVFQKSFTEMCCACREDRPAHRDLLLRCYEPCVGGVCDCICARDKRQIAGTDL